jgi:hypothetical protein
LVGWLILLFLVVWLILPSLISWLIFHFLVKFVIMLFMEWSILFCHLLVSILSTCQLFILSIVNPFNISFSIWIFVIFVSLKYVFWVFVGFLNLEFLFYVLVFYMNFFFCSWSIVSKKPFFRKCFAHMKVVDSTTTLTKSHGHHRKLRLWSYRFYNIFLVTKILCLFLFFVGSFYEFLDNVMDMKARW